MRLFLPSPLRFRPRVLLWLVGLVGPGWQGFAHTNFVSDKLDIFGTLHYMYEKQHDGVRDFLVNRLYDMPDEDVEFVLPQLWYDRHRQHERPLTAAAPPPLSLLLVLQSPVHDLESGARARLGHVPGEEVHAVDPPRHENHLVPAGQSGLCGTYPRIHCVLLLAFRGLRRVAGMLLQDDKAKQRAQDLMQNCEMALVNSDGEPRRRCACALAPHFASLTRFLPQ